MGWMPILIIMLLNEISLNVSYKEISGTKININIIKECWYFKVKELVNVGSSFMVPFAFYILKAIYSHKILKHCHYFNNSYFHGFFKLF